MKWMLRLMLCMAFGVSYSHAAEHCYILTSPDNKLVYQSTQTPISLRASVSEAMARYYPGHHLTIATHGECEDIGVELIGLEEARRNLPLAAPANTLASAAAPVSAAAANEKAALEPPSAVPGKSVYVKGYQRKDGRYVKPHWRAARTAK